MDDELNIATGRAGWRRIAVIGVAGLVVLALGIAGGVAWSERRAERRAQAGPTLTTATEPARPGPPSAAAPETADEPVEVSLTPDAIQRAGIVTAPVRSEVVEGTSTVPATVTSNAYRETKVNSLVGGIVRHVYPELGVRVARGETLVVVFSHELAEAQMKYLSMQAMLQADHQKLTRTRKLAEIGAASRQEVEEVTAVHEAHATEVAAARQRLLLLGLTTSQMERLQDASHIVHGNSFSEDGHRGARFDYMLANPPFGVEWKKVAEPIKAEKETKGFAGRFDWVSALIAAAAAVALFRYRRNVIHVIAACAVVGLAASSLQLS